MSKFKLNYHVNATNDYYPSQNPTPRQSKFMKLIADNLSNEEYHELAHQLHGQKADLMRLMVNMMMEMSCLHH